MVQDQVDDDPHAAPVRFIEQTAEIFDGAVRRRNAAKVGDIVAVIPERRGIEGKQPQTIDTKPLQIVQLLNQSRKIPDAIVVAVIKCADMELVKYSVLVPERILIEHRLDFRRITGEEFVTRGDESGAEALKAALVWIDGADPIGQFPEAKVRTNPCRKIIFFTS